jgi:nucleobase:cation symporter-1, NCS1 family
VSATNIDPTQQEGNPEQEAAFSTLPVLREERIWGFGDFTWVNIGLAIATWAFLIGGSTALFVGAKAGIAAILIGNVIAVPLMALATCVPSGKYGLEQYTALRSVFGKNGTRLIVFGFVALIEMGWAAVLAIMFGRATTNVANEAFGMNASPNGAFVIAMALVAIAVSWFVLVKGPVSIKWFNRIVAPGLTVVTLMMLVLIFFEASWGELLAAEPIEPFGDPALDFMIAVEFNLAAGFSWWPVMGSLARLTRTQRAAFWPNMIGLYAAAVVASIVGLLAALALGDSDPTVWMVPLGGVVLGILALVFVAFANVTSIVSIIYSTCLAIRLAGGRLLEPVSWAVLTGAFFLIPAVAVFFPSAIYDNFFKFLVYTSLGFAPLSGVYLVDYFFVRRRRLHVRDLYEPSSRSRYAFWGEFNPAAIVAVIVGAVVYYVLLNPLSLEGLGVFRFVSASIPSFLSAGVVHYALTRLFVQRLGKGGYEEAEKTGARP